MVAKKIKAMKENKYLGMDGIPPKLLMETVEQISIQFPNQNQISLLLAAFQLDCTHSHVKIHKATQI